MNEETLPPLSHLFICSFGSSCGAKGGEALASTLKSWIKTERPEGVKITKSGCLGFCEKACVAIHYPSRRVFKELTIDDAEVLKKIVLDGLVRK